eukprot:RCo028632
MAFQMGLCTSPDALKGVSDWNLHHGCRVYTRVHFQGISVDPRSGRLVFLFSLGCPVEERILGFGNLVCLCTDIAAADLESELFWCVISESRHAELGGRMVALEPISETMDAAISKQGVLLAR